MKLCMGCMNEIEDHLSTCPYCGFNETALRQESYYLDPGTIIGGKYIVGRVLSYGGHTVSYMGMDAEKNRKVIVKEYLPSDFSTRSEGEKEVTIYSGDGQQQFEQGLTNFLNEANRIQHLRNINGIAKVYDCVSENETGYVISEYVEGHTLKEILENGKRYSAEEAANFICKILQGLVEVHRMDIVHCDISPETIMVTNSGDIKLTDFGATRYVTTANSKSLSIILKRGFAPEEQYRSRGVRGPWTDVYALGAVMYDMLTGTVPQESVERALSDDLKEPSKLGISIPKNMENALMNALNVYQKDRTPSAEAFLAELNSREVKRIKVKQQKNKTGKIPVWAKTLVAGLACVVVAGGVYIVKNTRNSSTVIATNAITMVDLTGQTKEEVQDSIEKLKEQGLEVELKTRLEKFQRREFYRYECSIDFKFFELTEEQADLATVEEIFAQLRDEHFNDKIRTGTIVDISGGGIRFNSDTELKSGDHILAVAHLANERMNQEFHIVGSVISCEKKEQVTEKKYVSRVKFMIKDDRVREDIIRYIFEEERLTRQKDKR